MNSVYIKHSVKVIFALAIIGSCFYFLDLAQIVSTVKKVGFEIFFLALLLTLVGTIIIPAIITKKSLAISSLNISLSQLIQINLAIRFYILILPRAVAIGMRWLRYKKQGRGDDAAALIIFERVVQFLIISLLSTLFIFKDLSLLQGNGYVLLIISSILLLSLTILFLLFVSPNITVFFDKYFLPLLRFLPKVVITKIDKLWVSIHAFHVLPKNVIFKILVLSVLSYFFVICSSWVLAMSMGINVSLFALIWIRSVTQIITMIPFSVGGIGFREISSIYFFGLYGISAEIAFAYSLTILGIQLSIGLCGALLDAVNMSINRQ